MSVSVDNPIHQHYLVFSDSELRWLQWLKKGFQHVALVRLEYGKIWNVIQDGQTHLSIKPYLVEDHPCLESIFGADCTIIAVDPEIQERYRGHICWFNCVEVCKAVLGIRKFWVFTPYQLYRYADEQRTRSGKRCAPPSKQAS